MTADYIYDILKAGVGATWPLTIGVLPATRDISVCITEYDGVGSTEYFEIVYVPNQFFFSPF